jgi:hypothetical protein
MLSLLLIVQEDKENMQKELQAWRSEAGLWQQRFSIESQGVQISSTEQASVDALAVDVARKLASIRLMKRQMLENEAKLANLLNLAIGDA